MVEIYVLVQRVRMHTKPVLVTGATGYVGGRLVPKLLEAGYRVRALGRSIAKLKARPWANHSLAELAKGDVLNEKSLLQVARPSLFQDMSFLIPLFSHVVIVQSF